MSVLSQIETPTLENLPMIDRAFAKAVRHDDWRLDAWVTGVAVDLDIAFACLSSSVVSGLFKAMQPIIGGKLIQSAEDLDRIDRESLEDYLGESELDSLASLDSKHLQLYLLQRATFPEHIDWRQVADVFNEALVDQKSAIDRFFWEFCEKGVVYLLNTKSMDLPVPSVLYSKDEVLQDGDERFVYCNIANAWMREEAFYRQFVVRVRDHYTTEGDAFLGFSGTLEQAFAKATLYAMSKNNPAPNQVDPFGMVNTAGGRPFTLTLRRRHSLLGSAEINHMNTSTPRRLEWSLIKNGAIDEKVLRAALYSTEKLLGVQWSKVRDLEGALGL
jgi:hypothetical protein